MTDLGVDIGMGIIKAGVFISDVLTYPLHTVLQQPWKRRSLMDEDRAKEIESSDGVVYHNLLPVSEIEMEMKRYNIDTVAKAHKYAFTKYADHLSMGTRTLLNTFEEKQRNGKIFQKVEMGEYTWITFKEAYERATSFGRGLRAIGHQPKENIVLFAETRADWMVSTIGAISQNIPVCTMYATLGEDALTHGIIETEAKLIVTSHDSLPKLKNIIHKCKNVEKVIYFKDQLSSTDISGCPAHIKFFSFDEVMDIGKTAVVEVCEPKSSDICIIMYTSGSTGPPKGVIMSHFNLCSALLGYASLLKPMQPDIYLSYLPLSHVLEIIGESLMIMSGVQLGYSSTLTMTDRSTKIKRGTLGDVSVLRPTILPAVPLVLDRLYKGILDKVSAQGKFLTALFSYGVQYRMSWASSGFDTPFCNWFVFRKIKALLGGSIRIIAIGGAPLSPDTHEFVKTALGVPVIQGYGLTETCGCASLMHDTDPTVGHVGHPLGICDVKLINWDEGNYNINDKPNPRGEVVIGGNNVTVGYYKNSHQTSLDYYEIDNTRWFRTGDIGEFLPGGALAIIDRRKDLVKLQGAEYVSLGKVERELKVSPLVENICVYAKSSENTVVAIVSPDETRLKAVAETMNKDTEGPFDQLCTDKEIIDMMSKELISTGKKAKLEKMEFPASIYLTSDVWTPDTGLVTAAFKLRRKPIQDKYQTQIDSMYRNLA